MLGDFMGGGGGHPLLLSVTERGQKPIDILRNKNPELALLF